VRHDHAEKSQHLDSFEFDVHHRPNSGPPLAQKGPPRRPVPMWTPATPQISLSGRPVAPECCVPTDSFDHGTRPSRWPAGPSPVVGTRALRCGSAAAG